jgi:hypothetical protein
MIEAQVNQSEVSPYRISDFIRTRNLFFHDFVKPLVPTMLLSLT